MSGKSYGSCFLLYSLVFQAMSMDIYGYAHIVMSSNSWTNDAKYPAIHIKGFLTLLVSE